MITTCTTCGKCYEAGSEEQANEPTRFCPACWRKRSASTPGPWHVRPPTSQNPSRAVVSALSGGVTIYDAPLTVETAANARLIAAAPALLDELIAAQAALAMVYAGRTNWRGHLATLETVSAAMKSARAAIASATNAEGGR